MKSIILLVFVFISYNGYVYSQVGNGFKIDSITHIITIDSVYLSQHPVYTDTLYSIGYIADRSDTNKCLLLVSDSSLPFKNNVVWIKGYVVYLSNYYTMSVKYLDVIKQPLQKSIIVWEEKRY